MCFDAKTSIAHQPCTLLPRLPYACPLSCHSPPPPCYSHMNTPSKQVPPCQTGFGLLTPLTKLPMLHQAAPCFISFYLGIISQSSTLPSLPRRPESQILPSHLLFFTRCLAPHSCIPFALPSLPANAALRKCFVSWEPPHPSSLFFYMFQTSEVNQAHTSPLFHAVSHNPCPSPHSHLPLPLSQTKLTELHKQIEELSGKVSGLQTENAALHSRTSILEKVLDMRNEQIQVMQETKEVGG